MLLYTHTRKPVIWHWTRRGKLSSSLGAAKLYDVFIIFTTSSRGTFLQSVKTFHLQVDMVGFVDDTSGNTASMSSWTPNSTHPNIISSSLHTMPNYGTKSCVSPAALCKLLNAQTNCFILTSHQQAFHMSGATPPTATNQIQSSYPSHSLCNLTTYTSHKTLGIHKAPAGQAMKQIDTLILKLQQYT